MSKLLFSQRQNIKKVVDVAEDLLGYRLNRLNNSLLSTTLSRPGMTVAPSSRNTNISSSTKPVKGGEGQGQGAIHEDEAKVILTWINKLQGSQHPLVRYTRQFDVGKNFDASSYQIRSMVVMLVANMFGVGNANSKIPQDNCPKTIVSKQKALAEIAETIYTAHMLHRTVVEVSKEQMPTLGKVDANLASDDGEMFEGGISMHQGNKMATLMGDLLLARCSKALSSLKNATVTEIMSESIADFSESEALALSARVSMCSQPSSVPVLVKRDLLNLENWRRRSSLGIGSLLQSACYSALILSGHGDDLKRVAGGVGHKIGLALQAHKDYVAFEAGLSSSPQVDLCSLPVIFQLENNPSLISSSSPVVIDRVHEEVSNSTYARTKTKEQLLVLANDAISQVEKFSGSSSKLLQDFLLTLSS